MEDSRVVLGSGKTLKIGADEWTIVDEGIAPVFPSLFTEGRLVNGVVYLSVAQTVIDAGNVPEAHVCARLRMDLGFAQSLRDQLDHLIRQALKPAKGAMPNDDKPDTLTIISYAIAAALLIPLGWWLQSNWHLDDWLRGLFH